MKTKFLNNFSKTRHINCMKKNVIWKILIYFIFYSICGFLLETIFAAITKRTIESRQSFLYGPFCIVYGIGAIALIFSLNKHKDNILKLFVFGMIVGCIVEYFTSYIGELIMHIKWWDYSNAFLNIDGRTCLFYAICWGILTVPLIKYLNPIVDKYIEKIISKISLEKLKIATLFIVIFMCFDAVLSVYALDNFLNRVAKEKNINIVGIDEEKESSKIASKLFSDEKIMMTYPNMLVVNDKNEIVQLEKILSNVKNYYYKFEK